MSRLRQKGEKTPANAPELRGPGPETTEISGEGGEGAAGGEGVDGDGATTRERLPRGRIGWDELWRNIKKGKYG